MKRITSLLMTIALVLSIIPCMRFTVSAESSGAAIWVDPTIGSDSNSGTESAPFKTIAHAKKIAAELSATQSVTVFLNGGTYSLSDTITFTASDSGQNGNVITFKAVEGETPIVSGGTEVSGWSLHDSANNIYKATVPATASGARQFYVNGAHQTRAMTETSPTDWNILGSCGYVSPSATTKNTNEHIIVDLGEIQRVSKVTLYPNDELNASGTAAGFPSDFTIETSTDGSTYTTVYTETDCVAPSVNTKVEFEFSPTNARYVKLNVTELGAPDRLKPEEYNLSLSEIEVGQAAVSIAAEQINLLSMQHIDFSRDIVASDLISFMGYYDTRDLVDHSYYIAEIPVSNICDGNSDTYISTGGYQSGWLTGLGGPMTPKIELSFNNTSISAIEMVARTENGQTVNEPVSFDIEVYNRNGTWETVATVEDYNWTSNTALFTFDPIVAQKIRISVHKLGTLDSASEASGSIYFQLTELSIYTPSNIAEGATVTAPNSWEYETMSKDNLTDGEIGVMYTSNSVGDASAINAPVTIDLGSEQSVAGVRLYPRDATNIHYPSALEIAVSTDGVNYSTILDLQDIPAPTGDTQLFAFDSAINARYVKVIPTEIGIGEEYNSNMTYRFQLLEIEVLPGAAANAQNPVPAGLTTHALAKRSSVTFGLDDASALHEGTSNENHADRVVDGIKYADEANYGYIVPTSYNLNDYTNVEDLEIHYIHWWCHSIIKTTGISSDGCELYFDRTNMPWYGLNGDKPTWIENAYAFIDQPGEWYIDDSSNTIYFKSDGSMSGKTAVLPVLEQLITFDNCQNIVFDGVFFTYTTWTEPNINALNDAQSGTYYINGETQKEVPAGIEIRNSSNIKITNCDVQNFGGGGIRIGNGSANNEISNTTVHDISSGGIWVGSIHGHGATCTTGTDITGNIIRNNYITRVGVDYFDSSGITVIYTEGTIIDHNEITNCPYTGISLGWGWNFVDTSCAKDNVISCNYIHNIGRTQHDGAPIYTLGYQPGTTIYGNYLHDYHLGTHEKDAGLYLDEGSEGIEVYDNVVGEGIYQWLKMWTTTICNNHWHDNFYAVDRMNNNGTNNIVENNTYVADADFSAYPAAQSIIDAAGLTDGSIKSRVTSGVATKHNVQLTAYPDAETYYFTTANGLTSFSIPNQMGGSQYNWLERKILIMMPEGTDITSLNPVYEAENGFTCNKVSGSEQNFTSPVEYVFTNGSETINWTVSVVVEVTTSGEPSGVEVTLDSAINNTSGWTNTPSTNTDGSITFDVADGFSGYIGTSYAANNILTFDMSAELYSDQEDWVGFALRSQDPYESLDTMYYIGFKNNTIEVQKWVDGQRTMLYGTIEGFTPIYGNIENTYFESNTRHSIKTGAITVPNGVRLFMYIDGQKVFDIIDNSNPITSNGFFAVYPMTHSITLYDYSAIGTSNP